MTVDGDHKSLITSINAKIIKRFCINSEHCVSFFLLFVTTKGMECYIFNPPTLVLNNHNCYCLMPQTLNNQTSKGHNETAFNNMTVVLMFLATLKSTFAF